MDTFKTIAHCVLGVAVVAFGAGISMSHLPLSRKIIVYILLAALMPFPVWWIGELKPMVSAIGDTIACVVLLGLIALVAFRK